MYRKITELWPQLLGGQQNRQNNDGKDGEDEDDSENVNPDQLEELRQSTMNAYKNLYWTRIIALDHYRPDEQK